MNKLKLIDWVNDEIQEAIANRKFWEGYEMAMRKLWTKTKQEENQAKLKGDMK